MVEILCFLLRQRDDLLHAWRIRNVADHFLVGSSTHLFLDFDADTVEINTHALQHVDGDALPQLYQAEEKVFRAEKVMIQPVGFLARERQHLLRSWCEITHGFIAHIVSILLRLGLFVQ